MKAVLMNYFVVMLLPVLLISLVAGNNVTVLKHVFLLILSFSSVSTYVPYDNFDVADFVCV
jgi:hypothetical protein